MPLQCAFMCMQKCIYIHLVFVNPRVPCKYYSNCGKYIVGVVSQWGASSCDLDIQSYKAVSVK